MRTLNVPAILAFTLFAGSAAAQQPTAIVLDVDAECADVDAETALVSELRLRLPQATVTLGNATHMQRDWTVTWTRSLPDGPCQVSVDGEKLESQQSLDMPASPEPGDIELAASQVAWLVSMTVEPEKPADSEPAPKEPLPGLTEALPEEPAPEAEPEKEPEAEKEPEPENEPKPEPEVEAPKDLAPEVDPEPQPNYTLVPMSLSLMPGARFPSVVGRVVPEFSLNLFGGENWGLKGFEAGLIYNYETRFMHGAQFALGFNQEWALGANLVSGDTDGVQFALGYNDAGKTLDGMQFSLGMNAVDDVSYGAQVTLGLNYARKVNGAQIAFAANLADDVDGFQLSVLNVADNVRGAQIGVVNISDTADAPIGLLNIMLDEPFYGIGWVGISGLIVAGVQHGGKRIRYMYLAAARAFGEERVFGAGLGISGHIPFEPFYLDLEFIAMQLAVDDIAKQSFLGTFRGVFGWELASRFAIFAGPAVNILSTGRSDGLGLVPFGINTAPDEPGTAAVIIWPELHVGLRF